MRNIFAGLVLNEQAMILRDDQYRSSTTDCYYLGLPLALPSRMSVIPLAVALLLCASALNTYVLRWL